MTISSLKESNFLALKTLLIAAATLAASALNCTAQIDLTTGVTGTSIASQSFNETRGVDVTVLSAQNVPLASVTLSAFSTGADGMAMVGFRIYNSFSSMLLYSRDTVVYNMYEDSVSIPISYDLLSGQSYRVAFYCAGDASDNSGTMFIPDHLPYAESAGLLQINSATSYHIDFFPKIDNSGVPLISFNHGSMLGIADKGLPAAAAAMQIFPNPCSEQFTVEVNEPGTFLLTDIAGKTILSRQLPAGRNELTMPAQAPPGLYLSRFSPGNQKKSPAACRLEYQ